MTRDLSTKWTMLAAMAALAMGPGCDAEPDDAREGAPLQADDEGDDALPSAPTDELTTHDHAGVVPGFDLEISLGGEAGEDVVLDWAGDYYGDYVVYRSTDPEALLEISLDEPLAPGVEGTAVYGSPSFVDVGAASGVVQTPHYYYRVGRVEFGELGDTLTLSTMVMKTTTAAFPGFTKFGLCMLDGPQSASELYDALDGQSVVAVWGWDAVAQSYVGWNPDGTGVDFALDYGTTVVAQLDASTAPYRSLVGTVPTNEPLLVTGQPGLNWVTVSPFYDGPTNGSYWVDEVGYSGVGRWNNDTQDQTWYWGPGYAELELEPCAAHYVHLPDTACTSNTDCDPDQLCYFVEAASCGEVAAGLCFPFPLGCEGVEPSPVCGCDGQTYESQCAADLAGVAVREDGECAQCEPAFGFEPEEPNPVISADGGWQLYTAAPPSFDHLEVPFGSTVLGTDGNRMAPYPGNESENSAATIGAITLGESLSFRSWHVDEGGGQPGGYYDRKRVFFESATTGQTWVLVDCWNMINAQAFCDFTSESRAGDDWDQIVLDTATLAGQTGNLRFEYQTLDSCCSFEQGWFIDDITVGSCGAELTSGPPQQAPDPNVCPAQCLEQAMFEAMVLEPAPVPPPDACWIEDWGNGGNVQLNGPAGNVYVWWDDLGGQGECSSSGPTGYEYFGISDTQAQACAVLLETQIAGLGLLCGGSGGGGAV